MHEIITFNGKKYTTATAAGKHFGYSKEYMLMLIKKGKFDGQKVGHKWFVDIDSATRYFSSAVEARQEQLKKLSDARKQELNARKVTSPEIVSPSRSQKIDSTMYVRIALLETLVIVMLGVSLGSFGYFGVASPAAAVHVSEYGFLKGLAVSVYDFFDQFNSSSDTEDGMVNPQYTKQAVHVAPFGASAATSSSFETVSSELFTVTTTSIASIANSFSDEVEVNLDPKNNTAIVTPQFRDGAGDQYRFLMVPVGNVTEK